MALTLCKECGKQISSKAAACPNCGHPAPKPPPLVMAASQPPRKTSGYAWFALIFFILVALGMLVPWIIDPEGQSKQWDERQALREANRSAHDEASEGLNLDFQWQKQGFNNVLVADVEIENKSPHTVADVEIEFSLYAPSGTLLQHTRGTIYQTFPAGSKRAFKEVNFGFINTQTAKVSARINNFRLVQ